MRRLLRSLAALALVAACAARPAEQEAPVTSFELYFGNPSVPHGGTTLIAGTLRGDTIAVRYRTDDGFATRERDVTLAGGDARRYAEMVRDTRLGEPPRRLRAPGSRVFTVTLTDAAGRERSGFPGNRSAWERFAAHVAAHVAAHDAAHDARQGIASRVMRPFGPTAHPARGEANPTPQ
jgi:hypothetical protein